MLSKSAIIFSLCCLLYGVNCKASLTKILKPCASEDSECLKLLWHDSIQYLADEGDKELGILPIDPMLLQNITVHVPGLLDLILIDGTLVGVKSTKFNEVRIDFSKGKVNATIDVRATLAISGHYRVSAQSSIIPGLVSDELLKADGQGKVKMSKLRMKLFLDFDIIKNEAGDFFLALKKGPIRYEKSIGGKMTFEANNIYLAGQDISNIVLTFINGNWKLVMDTFGGAFFDRGIIIFTELIRKVFKGLPAHLFFSDVLEQYFV